MPTKSEPARIPEITIAEDDELDTVEDIVAVEVVVTFDVEFSDRFVLFSHTLTDCPKLSLNDDE